jgi:hypothetical protein
MGGTSAPLSFVPAARVTEDFEGLIIVDCPAVARAVSGGSKTERSGSVSTNRHGRTRARGRSRRGIRSDSSPPLALFGTALRGHVLTSRPGSDEPLPGGIFGIPQTSPASLLEPLPQFAAGTAHTGLDRTGGDLQNPGGLAGGELLNGAQ